jgi:site-specific DNA-methyltransferase (adenine-specific)
MEIVPKGATVLDPFMGSGTTAVAALRTGRNFIGFELGEEYHRIATERVEAAVKEMAEAEANAIAEAVAAADAVPDEEDWWL